MPVALALPVLDTVTDCGALLEPVLTLPKLSEVGEADDGGGVGGAGLTDRGVEAGTRRD